MIPVIGTLCSCGVVICLIWAGIAKALKKNTKKPLLYAAVCFALTGVMVALDPNMTENATETLSKATESAEVQELMRT